MLVSSTIALWSQILAFQSSTNSVKRFRINTSQFSHQLGADSWPVSRIIFALDEFQKAPLNDKYLTIKPFLAAKLSGHKAYYEELHRIEIRRGSPYFGLQNGLKHGDEIILKMAVEITKHLQVVKRTEPNCSQESIDYLSLMHTIEECKPRELVWIIVRDRDVTRYV